MLDIGHQDRLQRWTVTKTQKKSVYTKEMASLIKQLRRERKLSRYALSKAVGCGSNEITEYEKGNVKPSAERLNAIFKALGLDFIPVL